MKNIIISNKKIFERKLSRIINDGANNLHVVSDFDKTLTPYVINGKKAESSMGQIRANGYLSEDYVKKAYSLHAKYYPIEINENFSLEFKSKKMHEWWNKHLKLLIKYKMNKSIIDDIITKKLIKPRGKSLKFYDLLKEKDIPLLIFSAGKGEFIKGFLVSKKKLYKNIHIISNFYKFDKKEFVKGYKTRIIHSFNKNETSIKNTPYYTAINHRKNVILLGDGEGDVNMVEGLNHDVTLKIGFLNHNKSKLLKKYRKLYDVVIINDSDMNYVNKLIENID